MIGHSFIHFPFIPESLEAARSAQEEATDLLTQTEPRIAEAGQRPGPGSERGQDNISETFCDHELAELVSITDICADPGETK